MKHKLFTLLIAVMANLGTMFAESGTCGDNLTWNLTDCVLTISGTGAMTDYTSSSKAPWFAYSNSINSVVIGDGVTSIGEWAFSNCNGMTSATIGNSVASIGDYAFFECSALTSTGIPNSVTTIGNGAFIRCISLESVVIPGNVTRFGNYAFYQCNSLSSVVFVYGVTSIGIHAFDECSNLASVSLPNSITSIEEASFRNCSSLTSVTIPNSVISIGESAFRSCTSLTSVSIPNSVKSIGNGAFAGGWSLASVEISNSVISIDESAFGGCSYITNISNHAIVPQVIVESTFSNVNKYACTLYVPAQSIAAYQAADVWKDFKNIQPIEDTPEPCITASGTCGAEGDNLTWTLTCDSVLTISGTGAMADYNRNNPAPWYSYVLSIKTVVVNEGVISIGGFAFKNCTSLTSIEIPNSVISIGDYAFSYCSGLTSIEIPNSVTSIGSSAFSGCSSLTSVTIPNSVTSIGSSAFDGCSSLTSVTIPNSVTSIGNNAFDGCSGLTSVVIPDGVTSIGSEAFRGCSSLTSVTIPNSVISIGRYAFWGCSSLTSIEIPNSVTSIGDYAFWDCSSLTSVTIPNSVTSIGSSAFSGCSGLTSIEIPNSVTSIGGFAFYGCSGLTSVHISDIAAWCTISFGDYIANPLCYAHNLYVNEELVTDLVIPESVTNIGSRAFSNYSGLTSVTISNSVTSIGRSAFSNCSSLTSVTIGNSVTSIGVDAFEKCIGLTSVTIPNSVTSIGSSAFSGCSGLTSVHISDIAAWCAISFGDASANPLNNGHNLYVNEELVTDLVIPNSVTSIGKWAFYDCSGLTSVTIPNSVTSIGRSAFSNCSSLTSVTIPNSVTSIGVCAFYECSGLTSIEIPNSVTSIGEWAFDNCSVLTSITNYATTPQVINANVFDGVNKSTCMLYVPAESIAAYLAADVWKDFKNIQPIKDTPEPCITASGACGAEGDNLTWTLTCDSVLTISGTGAMADYQNATQTPWNGYSSLIQSVIMNDNVTTVSNYAFAFCSNLKNVSLNQTLTTIGEHAFFSCPLLESVVIPDNVIVIGYNAFAQCSWLTSVHIGNKVTTIGKGAFARCGRLNSVVMFNSVTSIGDNAFDNCSALTTINIPNSITSIGKETFAFCAALTSIEIPESVTSIGENAFYGCSGLTSVTNKAVSPQTINANVFTNINFSSCILYVPAESVEAYKAAEVWKEFRNILPIGDDPAPCVIASGTCGAQGDNLTWTLTCDSVLTISGTGAMADFEWSNAEGNPIIPWKSYREMIKYISLPEGLTSIGNYAFYYCTSLTSIEIPNSVISIGKVAFNKCSGLTTINVATDNPKYCSVDGVLFNKEKTVLVRCPEGKNGNYTIPNSVISIGNHAFYKCSGLTYIEIPNSVISIGEAAFYECRGLTSVTIPNSVTSIGDYAFSDCSGLTSIEIPNSVTSIGNRAFSYCSGLTSIEIPNSVTSIGDYAFYFCNSLTSIEIPNSVISIGEFAFSHCSGLTSIEIPNSVTSIGNRAFFGCSGLTSITNYATTPQTINANVFVGTEISNCTLYVPAESVEAYKTAEVWKEFGTILPIEGTVDENILSIAEAIQIGMALDSMATSAETYTIEGYVINARFYKGSKYQSWYMADDPNATSSDFQAYRCYPIDGTDTVEVHNGSKVRMTGKLQKYYDRIKSVYVVEMKSIPATILTKIQLDTITVAEALALGAELEDNASTSKQYAIRGYVSSFSPYYEQLGEQDFYIADDPNSTANTNAAGGFYVYRGVPSTGTAVNKGDLVELTCAIRKYVPASGTNIKIENSEFPVSVTVLQTASDTCIVASGTCGAQGDNLTWTLTCDSVLTISGTGAMADYNRNNPAPWYSYVLSVKTVVVNEGVTSIGRYAFYECSGLTSIEIPNSVTRIGSNAFNNCTSLTSIEIPNSVTSIGSSAFDGCSGLTYIEIPNSVTSIGNYAFSGCSGLTSVVIPNGVTHIGSGAFYGCSRMTSINAAVDNPSYCSVEGVLFNKDITTLVQYPGGKRGAYTIPNSVISIGETAFGSCNGLTSIEIPNSVTNIGSYAFFYCSVLTSIEIPNSVTSIGEWAFTWCSGLTSITNYAIEPQTINSNVFTNVDKSTCTLYVPAESIEAYKTADVWKEFFNILPIEGTETPIETIEGNYTIYYEDKDSGDLANEVVTLHVPVAPVIEGFTFVEWRVVEGSLSLGITIQAVYEASEPTSAPEVYTNPANHAQKLIRNGNVYILTDDKVYTITGQKAQ